jgi:VCBS repeat-containing protein
MSYGYPFAQATLFPQIGSIGTPGAEPYGPAPTERGGGGTDRGANSAERDQFVYVPALQSGAPVVIDGGRGFDVLLLSVSEDLWLDPAFQADLAAATLFVETAGARDTFAFSTFDLSIRNIELLQVSVDGVMMTLSDDPVSLLDDSYVLADPGTPLTGNVLLNDSVPDLVAAITVTDPTQYGAVTIDRNGNFVYVLDVSHPAVAALGQGQTLADSFTYSVTDADGDTATATAVITIGADAPALGFILEYAGISDSSGVSVSSAGDFNGDGIDDFMVSAPTMEPAGQVYVIFGKDSGTGATFDPAIDLQSLDGSDGFVFLGEVGSVSPGHSIASLGDINGDGIDDVILGASGHRQKDQGHAGKAYVVFGTTEGFDPTFDLGSLDGTNGFVISGMNEDDALGYKVASAGDVNGDGINDMIVGGYGVDGGGPNAGAAFVVFGVDTSTGAGFDPLIEVAMLDGTNGFALPGIAAETFAGHSVGSAGDVNGDGIDDLVIGAYGSDLRGKVDVGAVYVVFGKDTATEGDFAATIDLAALDGTDGFVLRGSDTGGSAGRNVASAGDLNGDGIDDILIGGFGYNASTDQDGTVYVVFGRDTAVEGDFFHTINLATLDGESGFVIEAAAPGDLFGRSFASVGDINGDGIDDILIGAPDADPNGLTGAGMAYLIFGTAAAGGFGAAFDLDSLDGSTGYVFSGAVIGEHLGYSVNSPGDIDNDGVNDLVFGSHGDEVGHVDDAYVVFGGADRLALLDGRDGTVDGRIDLAVLAADDFVF